MKLAMRLVLVLALAGLGFWLWRVFFPSPEAVIRSRLAELGRTVSFNGNESLMGRAARILKLTSFFVKDVEIDYEFPKGNPNTLTGTDEITTAAQAAPLRTPNLQVEFAAPNVVLSADKESAVVDVTLQARMDGEKEPIVQELKFTFKKTKDGWIIIKIETVRTLSIVPMLDSAVAG